MKTATIAIFATAMLTATTTWATELETTQSATINTLDAVSLSTDEMASTFGKHLTITNGTNEWEHPVSAFHGTLTITPRSGAVLVREMLKP